MSGKYSISFNAPFTLWFTFACIMVFIAGTFTADSMTSYFVLRPVFEYQNPLHWFTLFSYAMGHADLAHLLGNLSFILLLGPILEQKYGVQNLAIMVIITVLSTALADLFFFKEAIIGCSGIVFMFIMLTSFANNKRNSIPLTFILVAVLFLGNEVLESYQKDQIAQFAHIIGGICGSIFGFVKGK